MTINRITSLGSIGLLLILPLAQATVVISPAPGFGLTWDGNDGMHFDAAAPPGGANAPDNVALASNGATPITSSDLGPELGIGFHVAANLTDGIYGNANSWISASADPGPQAFAGVMFPELIEISGVAFGRDNGNGAFEGGNPGTDCCGGQLSDRCLGVYTLQFTIDGNTWTTIGTLDYQRNEDSVPGNGFTAYFRHRYEISQAGKPVMAMGIRLLVPASGLGAGTAIDEIEVFTESAPPPRLAPQEEGGSDDDDNLAAEGAAFAKDALDGREIASLNDGTGGDGSAWIGATSDSFAGVSLGATPVELRSIAFGRDRTGAVSDRSLGEYTLQYTDVADPDESTPDEDWTTIGVILYGPGDPASPHQRHRFNFAGVSATGVRILTPEGAAIDELEIYEQGYVPPPPPALIITPAPGFAAGWDGNDGDFFDSTPPPEGALVPDNLALAGNGAIPFSSSDLGPELAIGFHIATNLNDGIYGNANSWISASTDPGPRAFAGIRLEGPTPLTSIAWGRDNGNGAFDDSEPGSDCCGGQADDRSLGTYTLQFTTVPNPDSFTPDGDWTTIADFLYLGDQDKTDNEPGGLFTEWLRHEYSVSQAGGAPIVATGIRILVPGSGLGAGTAIDEIELYGSGTPPELTVNSEENGDITLRWTSKEGMSYNVRSATDPSIGLPVTWPISEGGENIAATPPENTLTFPLPADSVRLFVVEEFPTPPASLLSDNFDAGADGWTQGSDGRPGTVWEHGAPTEVGPNAANSGPNCFGTNLSSNYGIDANAWVRSPVIDLSNAAGTGATLCFWQYRDIDTFADPTPFDFGEVAVVDADDESVVHGIVKSEITGSSDHWEKVTAAIPAAALGRMVKLEFRFRCDDVDELAGWYIDDVEVTSP